MGDRTERFFRAIEPFAAFAPLGITLRLKSLDTFPVEPITTAGAELEAQASDQPTIVSPQPETQPVPSVH